MSNELIHELVESFSNSINHPNSEAIADDARKTLAKARAYLETGGWTRVEDGLPVVPDVELRIEVWLWRDELQRPVKLSLQQSKYAPVEVPSRYTHWRYAEPTPEPPKG